MRKTSLSTGTLYIAVSSFVFILSGYLTNIWLGRYLGPTSYGVYGIIITLMTTVNMIQTTGLPQAVAKYTAEDESKSDNILVSGLILQLISTLAASILFFISAKYIATLFQDLSLTPYIQLSVVIFPLYGIYSLFLNYYNGLHYFKSQALIGIAYAVAKLVSVIIFVYFFQVYGAIGGFIFAPLIALLFFFHFPKLTKQHFSYKKIILFSIPLIGFAIFSNLLQSIYLFFIKALLHSDKSAGFYTANQNIAEMPFYGVLALASVLFPSISRSVSQNLHYVTKNLIAKSLRFTLLIIVPSVFLISATSLKILTFLYSGAYQAGTQSLSILVLGSGFFTIFIILTTIISSAGAPHKSAILAGVGVVITSVLCPILIPRFGLNGAAFSTTIAAGIMMMAAAIIVYRKFHVLFSVRSVLKILGSSLLIYFLAGIISVPTLFLPFLYLFLFAIYGVLLLIMKEITGEDVKLMKSLLPGWVLKRL